MTRCTCFTPHARSTDIDPPTPIVDKWCPIHGKDPDQAYDEARDREIDDLLDDELGE